MALTVKNLHPLGQPLGSTIPLVFVPDGFTAAQKPAFLAYCNQLLSAMSVMTPWSLYMNKFERWYVDAWSNQSGVSKQSHPYNPITPVNKDTFFKVYMNHIGLQHYYAMPVQERKILAQGLIDPSKGFFKNNPHNIFVIVISNSTVDPQLTEYGGGAEFLGVQPIGAPDRMSMCIVGVGSGSYMDNVFLHEFAHSFGDLDDEYVDDAGDPTGNTASPINSAYAIKNYEPWYWNYGNRLNVFDQDQGGWHEGARYISRGKWRETSAGLMASIQATSYGPNNESLLKDRIFDEA